MVLRVDDKFPPEEAAAAAAIRDNQCNFKSKRIASTRTQKVQVVDGTNACRHTNSCERSKNTSNQLSGVLHSGAYQWEWNQRHDHTQQCVVTKVLRKLCEFNGQSSVKMPLKWFLLCLFLFCTHRTTLARPNADLQQGANVAVDVINYETNVSPQTFQFCLPFLFIYFLRGFVAFSSSFWRILLASPEFNNVGRWKTLWRTKKNGRERERFVTAAATKAKKMEK